MPLMLVEADVLHRVLKTLEDNVHMPDLRQRQRTPILGLRAMVDEARRREEEYEERVRSADVIGCLECSVLNNVSHCRECNAPLEIEPVRCEEGDLQAAADRLTREREERARVLREREEEARQARRRRNVQSWLDEFTRLSVRAAARRRGVPEICDLTLDGLLNCDQCNQQVQRFVRREQDVSAGYQPSTDDACMTLTLHPQTPTVDTGIYPTPTVRPRPFVRTARSSIWDLTYNAPTPLSVEVVEEDGEEEQDD